MRALNELVIRGPRPEVVGLLQRLEGNLADGWGRDRELEQRLRGMGVGGEGTFCFSCSPAPGRAAAALWLQPCGPEAWHVSNIVPLEQNTLSDEEYNHILGEFQDRCLESLIRGSAVRLEFLPPQIRLEDYLSVEAAQALRAFSGAANRTSLHPADRERWQRFLFRAHREGSLMDAAFLEEWLASEGWPEEPRQQLAHEYETTRALLASYDEEPAR